VLTDDPALLARLRPVLGARAALDRAVFDDSLLTDIEALGEPEVTLESGVRLAIHPTPALIAIDVDAGAALADRPGKGDRHLEVNRSAIPDLARQIRLRNLSGAILVDFAGMAAKRRQALGPALAEALGGDAIRPRLLGFTGLGLAEIVRSRVHPPLHEVLAGPHAAGLAALRRVAGIVTADASRMPVLRASPAVVAALEADAGALTDLAHRAGRGLLLRADPGLPGTLWTLDDSHG
jgi:Ribonuclease G/E